jgi:glycosyltransferase involved in cell wall biosynthesis
MDHGRVSAVIPSFNYGEYVVEAVKSALAQTYGNMEVIVVDDGSTDDTRARLGPYMDRIRYVYQSNRGLSAARNTGIRHARGEWVALLDSDDLWHPEKTEAQLAAGAQSRDAVLIGSPAASQLPEHLPADPAVRRVGVAEFLTSTPMGPSSALVQRHCLEAVGLFDERTPMSEDREMWLRLSARYSCVIVDSPCWWYRKHEGQMNRRAEFMHAGYRAALEKFFREHSEYGHLRDLAYCHLYVDACMSFEDAGRRGRAAAFLLRSVWRRPWLGPGAGARGRWVRPKMLVRLAIGEERCQRLARHGIGGYWGAISSSRKSPSV